MSMGPKGTAQEIKEELLWVAKESLRTNLVHGTAGNFSARLPDGNVVLTPSTLPYETMTLDDLVITDLDANVLEGTNPPTTEKMLHLECLRLYDDIHAVIHCHAKYCTMFALTRQPIPCAIEEVEVFVGGDVPVAAGAKGTLPAPEQSHFVYRRQGLDCRDCGTPVALAELAARKLYWCPACQAP